MKDIVIVGAGGFGREVAFLIEKINEENLKWNILGFIDDNEDIQGELINNYPVIGKLEYLKDKSTNVVIAIANTKIRRNIVEELSNTNNKYPNLIHPNTEISSSVSMTQGTIITAGTILTVSIKIGNFVIIDRGCNIGHDVIFNDFVTILPSTTVSGNVTINAETLIGTGTIIIQGLDIGTGSIVGAGSVVIKDIPDNCTAVGVPASPIKYHR